MKRISIDNGKSFVSVEKAAEELNKDINKNYDILSARMSTRAILEALDKFPYSCSLDKFLTAYLEEAETDLIIDLNNSKN